MFFRSVEYDLFYCYMIVDCFCSDFSKESNGLLVLGAVFFHQINFDLLTSYF